MILSVTAAIAALSLGIGDRCAFGRADQITCGLERIGAAVATDPLGRGTWVVDEERDEVTLVSAERGVLATHACVWPERVVVAESGRAFVNCRGSGTIAVLDGEGFGVELAIGFEPRGLALDAQSNKVFIGVSEPVSIVELDASTLTILRTYDAPVAPDHLALAPFGMIVLARNSAEVGWISVDAAVLQWAKELLPGDASFFGTGTREWRSLAEFRREEREAIADLDARRKDSWNGQLLAQTSQGIAIFFARMDTTREPRSPSASYYGGPSPFQLRLAFVDGSGIIGRAEMLGRFADVTGAVEFDGQLLIARRNQRWLARITHDGFRRGLRSGDFGGGGIGLNLANDADVGGGAMGLAVSMGRLQTFVAFERSLKSIEPVLSQPDNQTWPRADSHLRVITDTVALSEGRLTNQLELGRALYYSSDATMAANGMSCQGCHPDGRDDGLAWNSIGEIRQTPLLANRVAKSAPYGWRGEHATLEASIEHSIIRLGGSGITLDELRALTQYVRTGLRTPPQPPVTAADIVLARGKQVFEKAECGGCHEGAAFTDGENHVLAYDEKTDGFNTPSLKSVAISAPYLHDGSAKTLLDLVSDSKNRMGKTSTLTLAERQALVAYLNTL